MISHWLLLLWYYGIKYLYPRYLDQNLPHFNLASRLALFHQCWMMHCDPLASISDDHDDVIGPGGSRLLPSYLWFIVVNHSLFYGLCGANIYTSRWLVRMRFVLFARRLYSKKEALFLYIESDGFELHNIWNKKQNKTKDKKSKGHGNIGLNIMLFTGNVVNSPEHAETGAVPNCHIKLPKLFRYSNQTSTTVLQIIDRYFFAPIGVTIFLSQSSEF